MTNSARRPGAAVMLVATLAAGLGLSTRAEEPRRVRVGDESGRTLVARVHGGDESTLILLPDGHLARSDQPVYTDEPFVPATFDEVREALRNGSFEGFTTIQTEHYLVASNGSASFARASAQLLESQYKGLLKSLGEKGLDVHEAEFPLVAIIYRTEAEFRARRRVDADVQAYYETGSNRIYLYETADRVEDPNILARRKPQTVAHEGAHQVLSNIGIQPRMADWPAWLVEGLAEFCAPAGLRRNGEWGGLNRVNPFHMATLRDLDAPLSNQTAGRGMVRQRIGRPSNASRVETLVRQDDLSPTDYALAWALTHYLVNRRNADFVAYVEQMGRRPPGVDRSPDEHLADFRAAFGRDPGRIDILLSRHLSTLKNYEPISYFAVVFEQPIGSDLVRRGTLVSQSPAVIRQWLDEITLPDGGVPQWHARPFASRATATRAVQEWINGRP